MRRALLDLGLMDAAADSPPRPESLPRARERFTAKPRMPSSSGISSPIWTSHAIGTGNWQLPTDNGTPPRIAERNLALLPFWTDVSGTNIDLDGRRVDLAASVEAATELAQVVERVRARYLVRTSNDANAAMKRRYERYMSSVWEGADSR